MAEATMIIITGVNMWYLCIFFFSSRRRHTRLQGDWSSDVCSSDLSKPKMWGFQFTNNVVLAGEFPVWSAAGTGDCAHSDVPITSLAACFSSYTFAKNAIVASPSAFPPSKWPAGNYFPFESGAVEFPTLSDGSGGNYQLLSSSPFKNFPPATLKEEKQMGWRQ